MEETEVLSKSSARRAIVIGAICIFSYLVSYYSRNLLGVTSPFITEDGVATKDFLGLLSTVYMVVYASGQLVNGILGDILNPKKMILVGLLGTASVSVLFPFVPIPWLQVITFGLLGFFLSLLRGPLMKIIAENTEKNQARTIGTFFSVASFAGPLVASFLTLVFPWKTVFIVAGCLTAAIALCAGVGITVFERRGYISYRSGKSEGFRGVLSVFKIEKFFFYMIIGAVVETLVTAVSFWVPTYLSERLLFSPQVSGVLYSVISFIRALMPFASLAIFRAMKENDILLMRIAFSCSVGFFLLVSFVTHPIWNVILLTLALCSTGCASALLWSIYIPGMGKTGKVSSINGILDCSGYIVAAICNFFFGLIAEHLNWMGVVLLWAAIAFVGMAATLFRKRKKA